MRLLATLFTTLLIASQSVGQIELTKLSESTYICVDRYFARENSMFFIGPEHVTIIGATWTPATAEELYLNIREVTSKPIREVINTNYHPDRAGGNGFWKEIGCEIHSTKLTYNLLKSDWQSICDWTRASLKEYPENPLVLPSHVHEGSFELQDGMIEVIYLGPSHTQDGVFVYLPKEKLLYGGCILKPYLGNLEQANLAEYPITLQKLKERDIDIDHVIAGHGPAIHDSGLIDHYLYLLKENAEHNH